jgi:hypothetical protein
MIKYYLKSPSRTTDVYHRTLHHLWHNIRKGDHLLSPAQRSFFEECGVFASTSERVTLGLIVKLQSLGHDIFDIVDKFGIGALSDKQQGAKLTVAEDKVLYKITTNKKYYTRSDFGKDIITILEELRVYEFRSLRSKLRDEELIIQIDSLLCKIDSLGGKLSLINMKQQLSRTEFNLVNRIRVKNHVSHLKLDEDTIKKCADRGIVYEWNRSQAFNAKVETKVWSLLNRIDECGGDLSKMKPWSQLSRKQYNILERVRSFDHKNHIKLSPEMIIECTKRGINCGETKLNRKAG